MEFIVEQGKKAHGECSTLVLPALSIGNVGQLAVDLLIASKGAERIGYLDDPNILPCIGNDAFGPVPKGDLTLPLEVYSSASNKLTFVQQRSPLHKGMMLEFAQNLADFAVSSGMEHVIVLSSLDFRLWKKIDMSSGMPIHYLSSSNEDGSDDDCDNFGWKRLHDYNPSQTQWTYLSAFAQGINVQEDSFPDENEDYYASLPFAALFSCFKAKGLKVTCVLCYCSEGDNIPDSFNLAEAASKILGLNSANEDSGWVTPLSWKSVYGPPPDLQMF